MAGYIGTRIPVVSPGAERKRVFNVTGSQSVFTGVLYTPGFVHVFKNGERLVEGTDYTGSDGTSITLTTPATGGDVVVVISNATFDIADVVPSTGGTFQGPVDFADSVSFLEGSLGSAAFLDSDGFGSAAFLNTGSSVGDLVAFDSDGSGNASLNTPNITDSDGVTVQTTYVTNGSAKAWVNFNGTGTIAARDSLNVSSLTDNNTGEYTVNVTNAFGAVDYTVVGSTSSLPARTRTTVFEIYDETGTPELTVSSARVSTSEVSSTVNRTRADRPVVSATFNGDLAS
jgi:hypothetical protein